MLASSILRRSSRRIPRRLLYLSVCALVAGCFQTPRAVVPVRLHRTPNSPRDAEVVIDEEYIGPLYLVVTQGLRLPVGRHRVTVTREGYFPWDRLIETDRAPVELAVDLVPIPE